MKVYSVYDSKGEFFDKPFIQRNAAEALRGFETAINSDHDSLLKRFPGDYTLFEIGSWDDTKGVINMHTAHANLGNGLQFRKDHPQIKSVTQ